MNASALIARATSPRPSHGWLHRSAAGALVACAGLGALSGCGSSSTSSTSSSAATTPASTSTGITPAGTSAASSRSSDASSSALPALQPDARQAAHLVAVPGATFENFKLPSSLGDVSGSEADDKQARAMGLRTVNYAGPNFSSVVAVAVKKGQDAADINFALSELKGTTSYRNGTILCGTTGTSSTCISRFGAASYISVVAPEMAPGQAAAYAAGLLDAQK